ncbi:ClpXP protease specificity-enhancing factor [Gayadomonas joobiniege]|uniref:ClpXP protease specificity-enhancing factor n=1 Tax=Gayadomonas joobiniege TaxID=1234606 RepID=UPI0004747641|nr:ClpXP protease specificity-enhancing factor [Gayadomonas joobiniege]
MTNCKPYLLRAIYQWIEDNACTPYLLVDANYPGVQVPFEYVKDGQIVLNVSSSATGNFVIGDQDVEFNARFGGTPRHLIVPVAAILFLYAKENGEGMPFAPEAYPEASADKNISLQQVDSGSDIEQGDTEKSETAKNNKVSHLKVIK